MFIKLNHFSCFIFHDFGRNVAQEVQSEIFKYMIRKRPRRSYFVALPLTAVADAAFPVKIIFYEPEAID